MRHRQRVTLLLFVLLLALSVVVYTGRAVGPPIEISEVLVGNASTNLDPQYTNFSAWVELHNTGASAVNLNGLRLVSLREGRTTPQSYTLPSQSIPAGGYVLVWYDELTVGGLHTPYELDMDGGWIELRTAANELIDGVTLAEQRPDVSYGRAGGGWAYLDPPTPGAANTSPSFPNWAGAFAAAPQFSVAGGRYNGARTVTLSTTEPGGQIRYTLDGSKPTATSPLYSAPLAINTTAVLRARTFAVGRITSPTITHTYLINVPANLPAVSIAINPAYMFDNQIGIYVIGTNGVSVCGKKANWHQPWERPASMEMYDTGGARLVSQDIGFEIHGNCTRNLAMKSFEIKARKLYGDNDISYPLFSDRTLSSYRRLVLRTGGQDSGHTLLRDALGSQMLSGRMTIERGAYRPTVVYINGQFWGVYALREKMDENLVENQYGLDEETDFDALEENGVVLAGSAARWNEFYTYVKTHDPASPAVYAYLKTQMDMEAYIDYQIAEIYAANTDWPQGNVRFWRAYTPASRWRWILHDLDLAFGNDMPSGHGHNTLKQAMSKKGPKSYHGIILSQLSRNAEFRALFAQRFAAHLNTTFAAARMVGLIDGMAAAIAPDMPAQVARWKIPKGLNVWNTQLAKLRTFVTKRPDAVLGHLNSYLSSPGTTTLTTVAGAGGDILVAGVAVPDLYSGLHFRATPLTLRAVPAPGQLFLRWQETGQTTAEITVTFNGPATYTAVFDAEPPPPPVPDIVINEIYYRPQPDSTNQQEKEFIEFYHAGATAANLSGYTIDAISYTFPAGSIVQPGAYFVVAANSANPLFAAIPAGNLFDWEWGDPDNQKLSNSGETVTLRHSDGRVVDTVSYTDDPPWPTEPDTSNKTLALLDETLDNTLAASWAASRQVDGTPGAENFPPLPPTPPLVINEIHYNPTGGTAFEFVEIVNTSAATVDLTGLTLEGVAFTFPAGATIAAGEFIIVAADDSQQGSGYQVFEWTAGELADDGERVALLDAFGQTIDEVTYGDGGDWPAAPDGNGPTLSLGAPGLDNGLPANWAASRETNGTPGAANFPPLPLVINELHHTPAAAQGSDNAYEFLELYNAGAVAIDLSGYQFVGIDANAADNPLPAGTSIAPGEYIVIADTPATYAGNGYQVFDFNGGLSSSGETIAVSDRFGTLVDSVTYGVVAPWPDTPNGGGPSLSLLAETLDNGDPANWAASRAMGGTPGAANFPPLPPTPPLVINEIHYNPAGGAAFEFIEIVNDGPAAVDLTGFVLEGVTFTFPAGANIAAGEHVVIAANAANYAGAYQAFQWDAGDLADDGERVALRDPVDQLVDEVTYGDGGDWPAAPDGNGPTLSLGAPGLDNGLPANWAASDFDGGTPGATNWPPLPLVVSEVHYKVNETLQPGGDDAWEFFEVYNAGDRAFNLSGYSLSGVTATFAGGASLAAGETMVVANDAASYAAAGCAVYEWASGGLSSSGETLKFLNRFGAAVVTFAYGTAAPWPAEPNGGGPTLALLDLSFDNSDPANWAASRETGGTPCAANFPPLPPPPPLVINEIHYNPADAQGSDADYEFIEIINAGATAVDLAGFQLQGVAFTFPVGASIAGGEHVVVAANAASYAGAYQTFQWDAGEALADDGERVALLDGYGQVVDDVTYGDAGDWPAAPDGGGPSLELNAPGDDNSLPANWVASDFDGGSPGAAN